MSVTRQVLERAARAGCAAGGATRRSARSDSVAARCCELRLVGDDLADEHRRGLRRLEVAEADLDLSADLERGLGDALALRVGHADRRHVRAARGSCAPRSARRGPCPPGRAAAVDRDRRRGDVLAGRHQSSRGQVERRCRAAGAAGCRSRWPRRRSASGSGRRRCWWAIDCSVSPSRTTWTPSPPSERVVGFVLLVRPSSRSPTWRVSACVSASLTSARIGVAVRLEQLEGDRERRAGRLERDHLAPLERDERRAPSSRRRRRAPDGTSIILNRLSVISLTDLPPFGQRLVEQQVDLHLARLAAAELALRQRRALDRVERPVVALGDRELGRVEERLDLVAALDRELGLHVALGHRHGVSPRLHLQAGVDDLERLGRDLVGARVQVRPGPLDRERVRERPGAHRPAVRADERRRSPRSAAPRSASCRAT